MSAIIPRWRVAMRLATGTDIHAHLSAVVCENEGSGDGWSPYSQSSRFTQFEQIEVLRNRDVERVIDYERSIRMDGAAKQAAEYLDAAIGLYERSGGAPEIQAAAVLEAVRCIEALIQACAPTTPRGEIAQDDRAATVLRKLEQDLSRQKNPTKRMKSFRSARQQIAKLENLGASKRIDLTVELLSLSERTSDEIKRLWSYRNSHLAHPGALPPMLEEWVNASQQLGRTVLEAYLIKLSRDPGLHVPFDD